MGVGMAAKEVGEVCVATPSSVLEATVIVTNVICNNSSSIKINSSNINMSYSNINSSNINMSYSNSMSSCNMSRGGGRRRW